MRLPPRASYAIGRGATWVAWRLMAETRAAIADNLRAIFPDESQRARERRARTTLDALRARRHRFPARTESAGRSAADALRAHRGGRPAVQACSGAGTRDHPRLRPLRQLGGGGRVPAAHRQAAGRGRRDDGAESRSESPAPRDTRAHRRRHDRGRPVVRHRAPDPAAPRRRNDRADLMDRHCRPRPRSGEFPRPTRVVSPHAGPDGVHDRRAAPAVLHRNASAPASSRCRRAARSSSIASGRATRPSTRRHRRSQINSRRAFGCTPSSGISFIATGMRRSSPAIGRRPAAIQRDSTREQPQSTQSAESSFSAVVSCQRRSLM